MVRQASLKSQNIAVLGYPAAEMVLDDFAPQKCLLNNAFDVPRLDTTVPNTRSCQRMGSGWQTLEGWRDVNYHVACPFVPTDVGDRADVDVDSGVGSPCECVGSSSQREPRAHVAQFAVVDVPRKLGVQKRTKDPASAIALAVAAYQDRGSIYA